MNILITGASKGIGYELVKAFAADEKSVIAAVSRNEKKIAALKEKCTEDFPSSQVYAFAVDIQKDDLVNGLLGKFPEELNSIDILINNAGYLINKPFQKLTDEDVNLLFGTNVMSVFRLIRSLYPLFNENSHIINISSMGGVQGSVKFPGLSGYSASKGALAVLTECLAEEFREKKIYVNCLALGAVQTEMLSTAFPGYKAPLTSAEMAKFIKDFAMNGHHYFNGKILPVSLSTP